MIQADLLGYDDVRIRSQQVENAGELLTTVAGLPSEIDALDGLRMRDTGLLGELGGLGACPIALMNARRASRIDFWMGIICRKTY
jgi:hypothetical protein